MLEDKYSSTYVFIWEKKKQKQKQKEEKRYLTGNIMILVLFICWGTQEQISADSIKYDWETEHIWKKMHHLVVHSEVIYQVIALNKQAQLWHRAQVHYPCWFVTSWLDENVDPI